METITFKPAANGAEARPGWAITSAKPSIGVVLALACFAVLVALTLGMRLIRQTTAQSAKLIGSVESQYEPILRKSRELAETVARFERDVADKSRLTAAARSATPEVSASRPTEILDEYTALISSGDGRTQEALRLRLENFQNYGLAIAELCRQRGIELQRSQGAVNRLASRALRSGRGIESGDQVFSRSSLSELFRLAVTLRDSSMTVSGNPTAQASLAAAKNSAAVAALLRTHAAEFAGSPGRAWLELMREDLRDAERGRTRFYQLERTIATALADFENISRELAALIVTDLQQPAWQELTRAAGQARLAAESTEVHLTHLTIGILAVAALISAVILLGIAAPVRRLLEGTRRLARGTLEARVPRGGIRELDELAGAFNDMAEALNVTQKSLREHQTVLEDRIAKRTKELRHLAHHDPLTDLPNRRELNNRLAATIERARAEQRSCAVLYMDIDNFKTINDSLGHQFGDRVLREISGRLLQVIGSGDFLARLGGDEFTLIVENLNSAATAERYAKKIMQAFANPLRVGDHELLISLSLGIAMYPEHGDTTESVLRAADSALYDAKDRGRNGFQIYRAELLAAASHRFHTEQGLRRALETDDFLLHFQPEISLVDKRTTVVEALLRWRQPDGRIAVAGEFIEIAERSGIILELSDWLLHRAIHAARELRSGTWPQARVAINVSAQQFLSGRFVESVVQALRAAGMPPDCLEIELTESALQTGRLAIEALHELRRIGVAIALDDFGVGYSTLKSIEALPLTRVKLDRSLIKDIESSENAAAIAHSFVGLCQSLGLTVTAEGVEQPGQLDLLASCGDIQVQGYLISKPVPLAQIAQFIPNTRARLAEVWPQAASWRRDGAVTRDASPVSLLRPRAR